MSKRRGKERVLTLNPYRAIDWRKARPRKANLHLHTTQSDGYHPVSEVVQAYREDGYEILSITDHDWNRPNARVEWKHLPEERASPYPKPPLPANYPANPTWPWTDFGCPSPEDLGMIGIQGNELTFRHHIGSYFTDYGVWYSRTGDRAPYGGIVDAHGKEVWESDQLNAIRGKAGLAIINHPSISQTDNPWWLRKPVEWYLAHFQQQPADCLVGMEVANNEYRYHAYDEGLWDQLLARLMPHRPVWGFGADDMHKLSGCPGSFTVFFLETPSADRVRQAMVDGSFCFCTSSATASHPGKIPGADPYPKVKAVRVDASVGTIEIDAADCDEVRWITDPDSSTPVADYRTSDQPWPLGRVLATGSRLHYGSNPGLGNYARAELQRNVGGHVYRTLLNPFGFE